MAYNIRTRKGQRRSPLNSIMSKILFYSVFTAQCSPDSTLSTYILYNRETDFENAHDINIVLGTYTITQRCNVF